MVLAPSSIDILEERGRGQGGREEGERGEKGWDMAANEGKVRREKRRESGERKAGVEQWIGH